MGIAESFEQMHWKGLSLSSARFASLKPTVSQWGGAWAPTTTEIRKKYVKLLLKLHNNNDIEISKFFGCSEAPINRLGTEGT